MRADLRMWSVLDRDRAPASPVATRWKASMASGAGRGVCAAEGGSLTSGLLLSEACRWPWRWALEPLSLAALADELVLILRSPEAEGGSRLEEPLDATEVRRAPEAS